MSWPRRRGALLALIAAAGLAAAGCGSGTHPASRTTAAVHSETAPAATELGGQTAIYDRTYPPVPAAQRISARVSPPSGRTSQSFQLIFVSHLRLGTAATTRTNYRVLLKGPRPRCDQFTLIELANRGERVTTALHPPYVLGWCRGIISGSVLLETNPYCAPPTPGKTHKCRLFPSRFESVGKFSFVTK